MNRREALLAGAALASGNLVAADLDNKKDNIKHYTTFRKIDERLNNRIRLSDLVEGECGWITDQSLLISKEDRIIYFGMNDSSIGGYIATEPDEYNACATWVGKGKNELYIKPSESATTQRCSWFDDPEKDVWLMRPAMLAYYRAYPLVEKKGEAYVVPLTWKDCQNNELVRRNVEQLRLGVRLMDTLKDRYGILSTLSQWDHNNIQLKKALLEE